MKDDRRDPERDSENGGNGHRLAAQLETATAVKGADVTIGADGADVTIGADGNGGARVVLLRALDIEPARVRWIWPDVIASGKVMMLAGHPVGVANENAGDVIILSAEDDPADTVVPRLIAAGADRSRIHILKAVKGENGVERAFNLILDLDRHEKDHDLRQSKLVEIDPASAYLSLAQGRRTDRNHAGDVRTILDRLAAFAARHDLAVVAISHLNKSGGASPITRITGSQTWAAAPPCSLSRDDGSRDGTTSIFADQEQCRAGPTRLFIRDSKQGRRRWHSQHLCRGVEQRFRDDSRGRGIGGNSKEKHAWSCRFPARGPAGRAHGSRRDRPPRQGSRNNGEEPPDRTREIGRDAQEGGLWSEREVGVGAGR
jgi:hypothetical protein